MIRRLLALGTTFNILFVSLIIIFAVYVVGIFYAPVFKHLTSIHAFELIIACCLIELLYLQLSSYRKERTVTICSTERDWYPEALDKIKKNKPKRVNILSAGLSSRYQFIIDLLQLSIPVRVIIQGKDTAVDKVDSDRMCSFIETISASISDNPSKNLEIRASKNVVSVRAIIIDYDSIEKRKAMVSWYTYDHKNTLTGHANPTIFVEGAAEDGRRLLSFVMAEFDKLWNTSKNEVVFPHAKGNSKNAQ